MIVTLDTILLATCCQLFSPCICVVRLSYVVIVFNSSKHKIDVNFFPSNYSMVSTLCILSRKYFPIASVDREKSEDYDDSYFIAFALKGEVLKQK